MTSLPATLLAEAPKAELAARHFLEQVEGKRKPSAGKQAFSTKSCQRPSGAEWGRLLLMDQPLKLKLRFAPGCDLEGDVTLRKEGFPIDLKLRNVEGTERARGHFTPEVAADILGGKMDVALKLDRGILTRKGAGDYLKFDGDYALLLGASLAGGGSNPITVRENKGGKIRVSQYLSKPAQAEVPFRIE